MDPLGILTKTSNVTLVSHSPYSFTVLFIMDSS